MIKLKMQENAAQHFIKRAKKYNSSSSWVGDTVLIGKIRDLAGYGPQAYILDIAIGTGKIAQAFRGHVKCVVGVDICTEMVQQAKECADKIVLTLAENLPFQNNTFDTCVCRQGLQFMQLNAVLSEIRRILKPGGLVVLCHLAAYGKEDKDETFLIQKLRNPARKNFFLPEDVPNLLKKKAFTKIELFEYITRESVSQWIDNGAIDENAQEKIREAYRKSSHAFKKIHNIQFKNGDILDSMKMVIVRARKGEADG